MPIFITMFTIFIIFLQISYVYILFKMDYVKEYITISEKRDIIILNSIMILVYLSIYFNIVIK